MRLWLLIAIMAIWPGSLLATELHSAALGNIFIRGETPSFTLQAKAESGYWRAHDFFGNEVGTGRFTLTGGTAEFRTQISGLGYFKLDVYLDRDTAPALQTALAILSPPQPPSRNSPFGVMTHFAKDWPTDIIPLIGKAGIGRIRDEQPWRKVEKDPGQYRFPPQLSGYVDALTAAKIDPLIELVFSNPLYDNDKTPFDESGRAAYAAYASAVAERYRGQVSSFEIWNEYNGSFCEGPCRADRPAYYTAMLKQAYRALKAANPSLIVAGGASVYFPQDYFDGLFRQGALEAMDAFVIHPYRKIPEGVEEKIADLRQMMQRHGAVKPIWATEFGDTADMRKNRDNAASYLVRMSTLLLAGGCERIYWYLLKDYQEFAGMGLLLSESDPAGRYVATPAYAAYAALIRELDGAHFIRREPSDPELRIYLFAKGQREIRVAWSTQGVKAYELHGQAALQKIDMMGNVKTVSPQGGSIQLTLDSNPIYLSTVN